MRKLTSREIVLLLVVVGLGILGWVYSGGGPLRGGAEATVDPGELNFGAAPVVELARLGLAPENFKDGSRNLFSYYTPPAPPPPPRKAPPPRQIGPPAQRQQAVQPPPRKPPPVQKPKPPRPNFRYIGFMGPKDNKIAVLEQGEEVLLAGVGEIVDKQYKILEFKYEMLVIGYTAERWADETHELPMKR